MVEETVAVADLPDAVVAAVTASLPGGVITEAEIGDENGQTVYEMEVLVDGKEVDVEVSADGTVLEIDEDDDVEDDEDEDDDDEDDDDEEDDDDDDDEDD